MRPRAALLQGYRLAVFATAVVLAHDFRATLGIARGAPVSLGEVRAVLPHAQALERGDGGTVIRDRDRNEIGRALTTSPHSDAILGYTGPADTLLVLDTHNKIVSATLRWSADTASHVADVSADDRFWHAWRGLPADRVAGATLGELGVEGVSGATRTSLCIAEGIALRLREDSDETAPTTAAGPSLHDVALFAAIGAALCLSRLRDRRRRVARRLLQVFVVGYLGLYAGDLLAWSLFAGWTTHGAPWAAAPGLVALAVAALAVPWASGLPVYCAHLCPHGALQEWIGRASPPRWHVSLPAALRSALSTVPALLLGLVVVTVMLTLPIDLAGIEAFDAWLLTSAGTASLLIALVGLAVTPFVPMAYCRYGCPTGALLGFVRSHGRADHFGRRDVIALALLALAGACSVLAQPLRAWLAGAAPL